MLAALFLIACAQPEDSADSAVVEDTDPPAPLECEPAVVEYDGEDAPKVGDLWKVWLTCDGVLQMGLTRVTLDPVDAGNVVSGENTPEITWAKAGDASIHLQTGHFTGDRTVTIAAE